MKKRLAAFFAAVFLLFSLSETVEASASTYRNQLSRTECELYDAMVSYLPRRTWADKPKQRRCYNCTGLQSYRESNVPYRNQSRKRPAK